MPAAGDDGGHRALHALRAGFYQNDRVDDLLRRGRTTTDEKARIPLDREAKNVIVEGAPWIVVDHGEQVIVHRKRGAGRRALLR